MGNSNNSISSFKAAFNGGTRANRFEITSAFPDGIGNSVEEKVKFYASSLPRADVGTIYVGYRGRTLSFAGDRSYSVWNISIYDDNNTSDNLWQAFHKWKEYLDGHITHQIKVNPDSPTRYADYSHLKKNWGIKQLGVNGNNDIVRQITLYGCWPSQIGGINLDMSSPNQSTFNVTLTYDYYTIEE